MVVNESQNTANSLWIDSTSTLMRGSAVLSSFVEALRKISIPFRRFQQGHRFAVHPVQIVVLTEVGSIDSVLAS